MRLRPVGCSEAQCPVGTPTPRRSRTSKSIAVPELGRCDNHALSAVTLLPSDIDAPDAIAALQEWFTGGPVATTREQADPRSTLHGGLPDRYLTPEAIAVLFKVPPGGRLPVAPQAHRATGFRIGKYIRYDPIIRPVARPSSG